MTTKKKARSAKATTPAPPILPLIVGIPETHHDAAAKEAAVDAPQCERLPEQNGKEPLPHQQDEPVLANIHLILNRLGDNGRSDEQPGQDDQEIVALLELDKKLLVARDRIRQVGRKENTGFYWHGRPGTGKTHLVLATLDEMRVKYHYHKGHITAQGLLELMQENADKVIILDDVSVIFTDKKAVQYLLAALGRLQGRAWETSYVRQGERVHFKFTGAIICFSNLAIESKGMLAALKSRVHILGHSPTDLMLLALARHRICKNGWPAAKPTLTVDEANEVINWVWTESQRLNVAVDLRVLFDKALPDYRAWRKKTTEAHWKDLVTTTLEEEVNCLPFTPPGGVTKVGVRQATKEEEWEIVRDILKEYDERKDRVWAWKQRTNKSEKAFERRWAEVKAQNNSKANDS